MRPFGSAFPARRHASAAAFWLSGSFPPQLLSQQSLPPGHFGLETTTGPPPPDLLRRGTGAGVGAGVVVAGGAGVGGSFPEHFFSPEWPCSVTCFQAFLNSLTHALSSSANSFTAAAAGPVIGLSKGSQSGGRLFEDVQQSSWSLPAEADGLFFVPHHSLCFAAMLSKPAPCCTVHVQQPFPLFFLAISLAHMSPPCEEAPQNRHMSVSSII